MLTRAGGHPVPAAAPHPDDVGRAAVWWGLTVLALLPLPPRKDVDENR
ncbi:hypothetical protein WEH80_40045 [Actinomycetes bacterium KLBMP 9759]